MRAGASEQQGLRRAVAAVPHALVCPVLRHTGAAKADADMECILHMLIDVLALEHLEGRSAPVPSTRAAGSFANGDSTTHGATAGNRSSGSRGSGGTAITSPAQSTPEDSHSSGEAEAPPAAGKVPILDADSPPQVPAAAAEAMPLAAGEPVAAESQAQRTDGRGAHCATRCSTQTAGTPPCLQQLAGDDAPERLP